jgi:hypothetical protein
VQAIIRAFNNISDNNKITNKKIDEKKMEKKETLPFSLSYFYSILLT